MTEGLDVLSAPAIKTVEKSEENEIYEIEVRFESKPPPSPGDVTFVIERTGCESSCPPVKLSSETQKDGYNAKAIRQSVSLWF